MTWGNYCAVKRLNLSFAVSFDGSIEALLLFRGEAAQILTELALDYTRVGVGKYLFKEISRLFRAVLGQCTYEKRKVRLFVLIVMLQEGAGKAKEPGEFVAVAPGGIACQSSQPMPANWRVGRFEQLLQECFPGCTRAAF